MITGLTNLESLNDSQGRRIQVFVSVDASPTNTTLDFKVCDEVIPKALSLRSGESRYVSIDHDISGRCVVVRDAASDISTQKLLDLDASESS